jgi:hypothetical protein
MFRFFQEIFSKFQNDIEIVRDWDDEERISIDDVVTAALPTMIMKTFICSRLTCLEGLEGGNSQRFHKRRFEVACRSL